MVKRISTILIIFAVFVAGAFWMPGFFASNFKSRKVVIFQKPEKKFWKIQSVDTMKYSRDLALEKLNDVHYSEEIDRQVSAIAELGATHVAIATPYDEKFYPFLKRWVDSARKNGLKVWFRGNWSAWEGWFGFSKNMTRGEHIEKTKQFILNHPDIFEDGDIFSGCPECENGGPGDPRVNGDAVGHRQFIIDEYSAASGAFKSINKNVGANYYPMNMDVAKLVMDQKTTSKMGGLVVVDHYVSTPKQLTDGLLQISKQSGGKVMLGEWGVPIPDINGKMTDEQRAKWMTEALKNMTGLGDNLIGVNYWLALGGSTALWSDKDLKSSGMSEVVKKYYSPGVIYGRILDEFGQPVEGAKVSIDGNDVFSQADGYYQYNTVEPVDLITISHEDFKQNFVVSPELDEQTDIILEKENKNFISKLLSWIEKIPCLNSLNC